MAEMFPPTAVKRNPTDVELVEEFTLQQLSDWLIRRCGGLPLPEALLRHIRDLDALRSGLDPIFSEMQNGDSLWRCQSRFRDPLIGHAGVALVRDKQPVVYIRLINY